jgi:hypothetical protein
MSERRTFFRFCPACGKRFHITLASKELVGEKVDRAVSRHGTWHGLSSSGFNLTAMPVLVEQDVPVVITVEDFRYTYRCKTCGHVWMEMQKEQREFKGRFAPSSISTH